MPALFHIRTWAARFGVRVPAVLALVISVQAHVCEAEPQVRHTALLSFIRALEAPAGYDSFERRIPLQPPRPLTEMTLEDVLRWQNRVRRAGAPSTAAGGYQIIRPTLQRLVNRHGIAQGALFDRDMQDRLARLLVTECGPSGTGSDHPAYGNCLAGIWAALPLTEGPERGRSAYHGINGNRALTDPETVLAVLAGVPIVHTAPRFDPQPRARDEEVLAFDAVRVSRAEITAAMRDARREGSLTRSTRRWSFDPYAVD